VLDRKWINARPVLCLFPGQAPERRRIALDYFADAMADGFQHVIACGKAVTGGGKAAVAGGKGVGVVGVYHLIRHPDGLLPQEVIPFDPEQRQVRVEKTPLAGVQLGHVHQAVPMSQILIVAVLEGQGDVLGVVRFDGFHERRRFRLWKGQALALGACQRARVRPASLDHGNAESVQARDVGDPCDAHPRQKRTYPGEGFFGGNQAMRVSTVSLGGWPADAGEQLRSSHGFTISSARQERLLDSTCLYSARLPGVREARGHSGPPLSLTATIDGIPDSWHNADNPLLRRPTSLQWRLKTI
jgi:hypothetical protein